MKRPFDEDDDSSPSMTASYSDTSDWGTMNMDCLENIFSHLNYVQLVRVSMVCKSWQTVAEYVTGRLGRFVSERNVGRRRKISL